MRIRTGLFAVLTSLSILSVGCGKPAPPPPPGADTDVPSVDIDEGTTVESGEETTDVPAAGQ